jgi:predicted nucleic acid-binding protein
MKNKTLFVDTSAWYAVADQSDQYHRGAVAIYPSLLTRYHHLTTTNLVIAETYILIRRSIGHDAGIRFLENIATSPRIRKVYSDSALEERAEKILRKYQDQDFSYADAVSFSVMKQHGIVEAFSFDQHFRTVGFSLVS